MLLSTSRPILAIDLRGERTIRKSGKSFARERWCLSERRPGDLRIDVSPTVRVFEDTGITNPTCPSNVRAASSTRRAAANTYAAKKIDKYRREFAAANNNTGPINITYVPLIAETYGAWSDPSLAFLRHLSNLCINSDSSPSEIHSRLMISLDVCLQRLNAKAILLRSPIEGTEV